MSQAGSHKKVVFKDLVFFIFLFVACVVGSVGIFWFAVGIENGNVIMKNFLRLLLDNAVGIVIVLLLFNVFLIMYYGSKKGK